MNIFYGKFYKFEHVSMGNSRNEHVLWEILYSNKHFLWEIL